MPGNLKLKSEAKPVPSSRSRENEPGYAVDGVGAVSVVLAPHLCGHGPLCSIPQFVAGSVHYGSYGNGAAVITVMMLINQIQF